MLAWHVQFEPLKRYVLVYLPPSLIRLVLRTAVITFLLLNPAVDECPADAPSFHHYHVASLIADILHGRLHHSTCSPRPPCPWHCIAPMKLTALPRPR